MIPLKLLLLLATCAGAEKLTNVEGKIALVTGGAQGIGYATVEALLGAGIRGVTLVDLDITKGKTAAKALNLRYGNDRVIFLPADVSNESELEGTELVYSISTAPTGHKATVSHAISLNLLEVASWMFNTFKMSLKHWKSLDIVVNNAGTANENNWKLIIRTNIIGTVQGTFLGFKYMSKSKGGKGGVIINISSVAALGTEYYYTPVYSASKSFVLGMTRALGHQVYYDYNAVRIVTVCPGLTDSELVRKENIKTQVSNALAPNIQDIAVNAVANASPQSLQNVGDGIQKVIEDGSNGSVWVIEDDEPPYEIDFPDRQAMRKKDA